MREGIGPVGLRRLDITTTLRDATSCIKARVILISLSPNARKGAQACNGRFSAVTFLLQRLVVTL